MKTYLIKQFDGNWDNVDYLYLDNVQWTSDFGIRTKMQIAYDEEYLYLHMFSKEEDIRHELYGNEDSICEDSCMEFFFGNDGYYLNIEVNYNCKFFVGIGRGREDRMRIVDDFEFFNARASKTDDGWQVYYEIPFDFINMYLMDFIPAKRYKFRANCYKCGDKTKHIHYLTWNKIEVDKPDYHRPEYFGEMILD